MSPAGGALLVFLGGGSGASLRYATGILVGRLGGTAPVATLLVNMSGCLAMGLLAGWLGARGMAGGPWRLLLMTGLLGGFTTFSAFGLDTLSLWHRGQQGAALAYVAASVLLSLAAAAAGLALTRA